MSTNKRTPIIVLAAFLGCPTDSHAEFVGLSVVDMTDNSLGLAEYAIYAVFDNAQDELHALSSNITVTTGFFHNSIGGFKQSIFPYTEQMTAISDHPDADSFVTIGLATGDGNQTGVDQNFDVNGFLFGNTLGVDAGWYNSFPPNDAGLAGEDGLVLIAVFTPLNDLTGNPGVVSGTVHVGYGAAGGGTKFADASFITPGPAGLGLLALAGMVGCRRRRMA
jgi:hypothetical protein